MVYSNNNKTLKKKKNPRPDPWGLSDPECLQGSVLQGK